MMTVVYDSTGRPVFTVDADIDIAGYTTCDNPPEGYYLKSMNPETGEPIFEKIPKSDEQAQIDALKEQVAALQAASDEQKKVTDAMLGVTEEESEETA